MAAFLDFSEVEEVLFRTLDNLARTISSRSANDGTALRRQIGRVRSDYEILLANGGFGIALLACFRLAMDANAKPVDLAYVRQQLYEEALTSDLVTSVVMTAITFCLSVESRLITKMTFASRDDVNVVMARMKSAFDTAREMSADANDNTVYQTLTRLAGALTNHLATRARPLPRVISISLTQSFPALFAAHRIYYDASRWEELVEDNKCVHPAFMQHELRGLSA